MRDFWHLALGGVCGTLAGAVLSKVCVPSQPPGPFPGNAMASVSVAVVGRLGVELSGREECFLLGPV